MITAIQNQDIYIIRFQYDPKIVQLVKNVPGRLYDGEHKYWTIPLDKLGFLINQFRGTPYEYLLQIYSAEYINENATLDATDTIPDVDLTGIPLYVQDGSYLFNHQLDFMKYAIDRQRRGLTSGFILADEMGLGKSLEAMNLALYNKKFNKIKHCLIVVCVNSAKYNWLYDIEKHTNGEYKPYLLGSRLKRDGTVKLDGSSANKLQDLMAGRMYGKKDGDPLPFFIVLNIEAFHMRSNRKYVIKDRLTVLINKGYIGMVIIDEVHRNCLDYNMRVYTDKGFLKIGDIVENKLNLRVLSYNININNFEWKNITSWLKYKVQNPLIELTIDTPVGIRVLKCTPDHKIYTKNRGWVAAKDLCDDDDIVCN